MSIFYVERYEKGKQLNQGAVYMLFLLFTTMRGIYDEKELEIERKRGKDIERVEKWECSLRAGNFRLYQSGLLHIAFQLLHVAYCPFLYVHTPPESMEKGPRNYPSKHFVRRIRDQRRMTIEEKD
jgi:hypothetical protein